MASKSMQNIVLTLSFAESMSLSMLQLYEQTGKKSKTVEDLCTAILEKSNRAMELYPKIPMRDVARLEVKICALTDFINGVEGTDKVTGISLLMGMLSEVLEHVTDRRREEAFEDLHASVARMHRHFDRNMDHDELYKRAGQVMDFYCRLTEDDVRIVVYANDLEKAHVLMSNGEEILVRLPRPRSNERELTAARKLLIQKPRVLPLSVERKVIWR